MPAPNFILLYVQNPLASAAFYKRLLKIAPVEASPTFCMFALESGMMLGLWGRDGVQPLANSPGGSELAFTLADAAAVDAAHTHWQDEGIKILQAPLNLDFGYTFTAADPDGHRLRVFAPG